MAAKQIERPRSMPLHEVQPCVPSGILILGILKKVDALGPLATL